MKSNRLDPAGFLIVLLFLSALVGFIPAASGTVGKVTLSMDQPTTAVAELSYGNDASVEFTGKLTATLAGMESIIIVLSTASDLPHTVEAEFRPSEIEMAGTGTQNAAFRIILSVSCESIADEPIAVDIEGRWHSNGGTGVFKTNTERVEVRPSRYIGFSLSPRSSFVSGSSGSPVSFPVTVHSRSNAEVELTSAVTGVRTGALRGSSQKLAPVETGFVEIDGVSGGIPALSMRVIEVRLHGKEMLPEWGAVAVTLNATIKGFGIVEELTFYAQRVGDRLMVFESTRAFLLAAPMIPWKVPVIDDVGMPDSWDKDGPTINFEPSREKLGDSFELSLAVLLVGEERDVALKTEAPKGYMITWSPEELHLDHLEIGVFNVSIVLNHSYNGTNRMPQTMITIMPQAPGCLSTRVHALIPPLRESSKEGITTIQFIALGGGIALLSGLGLGSMEFSRYRLLTLLFFPLYSRIHEENALDNFVRGRIYQYIKDNPGTHYTLIRRELDLNNGVLSYHLHTLVRLELVKSRRQGTRKLFYITGIPVPDTITAKMNGTEMRIRQAVRERPGITQKELGEMFPDKSRRTISHYVKTLSRKDHIRLEKRGKNSRCFPAET